MAQMIYDEDSGEWIDLDKIGPHSTITDEDLSHGIHVFIVLFVMVIILKTIDVIIN